MRMLITFLQGIIVGMCNVIPGVSGGTLVVIFNIYDEFLSIMSVNIKKTIKNWRFVVPILLGIVVGVLIFSKAITFLYSRFPVQTNFFFTGLIVGSIPLMGKYVFCKKNDSKKSVLSIIISVSFILIGFAVIFGIFIAQNNVNTNVTVSELPVLTFELAVKFLAAGIVSAVAMIIPGVSGSLLMLIMGVYPIVIAAISGLTDSETIVHSILLLVPTGIGIVIGLFGGAWLIKKLLNKFTNQTYAVILGLIVGSIINIFPGFKCITGIGMGIGSVICLAAGIALAYCSSAFNKNTGSESVQN
ncbi:MAG: DUF368 domain-containing protein [Treponema sp.]|nr:DUF368 domain-containing protein [Treponema sp.]